MRAILQTTVRTFILVVVAGLLIFLLLPTLANRLVVPRLLNKLPIGHGSATICNLGFSSISGSLSVDRGRETVLSAPRIALSFSLRDLLRKKGGTLRMDQAVLHVTQHNGRYHILGWPESDKGTKPPSGSSAVWAFAINHLQVRDCSLILHNETGRPRRLAVSGNLHFDFQRYGAAGYRLHAADGDFTLTDLVSSTGTISLSAQDETVTIALELEEIDTEPLLRLLPVPLQEPLPGPAMISAAMHMSPDFRIIRHLDLQGILHRPQINLPHVAVDAIGATPEIRWRIAGPPHDLDVAISPFSVNVPEWAIEVSAGGKLSLPNTLPDNRMTGTAAIGVTASSGDLKLPARLDVQGVLGRDGDWHLEVDGRTAAPVSLAEIKGITHLTAGPTIGFRAQMNGKNRAFDGTVSTTLPNLGFNLPPATVSVTGLQLGLTLSSGQDAPTARLSVSADEVLLPRQQARAEGLSVELPLTPDIPSNASPSGSFSIESVRFQDTPWARLDGTLSRREHEFLLSGTVHTPFPPFPEITFHSSYDVQNGSLKFAWLLPPTAIDAMQLPPVAALPADLDLRGTVATEGHLEVTDKGISGSGDFRLLDTQLHLPERGLAVDGLACALSLPDLPSVTSAPSQSCLADSVSIGSLQFSDAAVVFRVENPTTVFIEKSRAGWCQGSVESGSIRLSTHKPEVDTVLYASRLNFAELLNQFGFQQTEGQGTLNGKLPVRWENRRLSFDDGFLFSTPGTGGIVRFTSTELLRQGIGTGSQTGSIAYSLQALEDFAYNWTKVSLNSSGDELLMAMELDGQPRTPLPFSFKDGMLVESQQGSLQYPVRLDINLRLPLTDLLQVGHNVKTIMGNR